MLNICVSKCYYSILISIREFLTNLKIIYFDHASRPHDSNRSKNASVARSSKTGNPGRAPAFASVRSNLVSSASGSKRAQAAGATEGRPSYRPVVQVQFVFFTEAVSD